MRFVSVQFEALLTNELWRRNAIHANAMAARLAAAVDGINGIEFTCPVEINALFPRLDPAFIAPLQERCVFYLWDANASIARWMTSFNTTTSDVDAFGELVREVSARNAPLPLGAHSNS